MTRALTLTLLLCHFSSPAFAASLFSLPGTFQDDRGRSVSLSSFRGKNVVVAMFYSECTSRCPMTLERLRAIEDAFRERGTTVDVVLVSFDERETAKSLARFRKRERLGERWHLLRGGKSETEALASAVGFGNVLDLGEHYVHPIRIVRLDAGGNVARTLDMEHRDVARFVE